MGVVREYVCKSCDRNEPCRIIVASSVTPDRCPWYWSGNLNAKWEPVCVEESPDA